MKGREGKREGKVVLTVKKHARNSPGRVNKQMEVPQNPKSPSSPETKPINEKKKKSKRKKNLNLHLRK